MPTSPHTPASTVPPPTTPPGPSASPWLPAADAAALLGVQRGSLYSYVSRGLLRAQRVPGQRGSVYLQADVQRLARQRHAVRNPRQLAQATLDWGQPVLTSAITLVQSGALYYRGQPALQLADTCSLEDVAALLWQQKWPVAHATSARAATKPIAKGTPTEPRSASQALASWYGVHADTDNDADAVTGAHGPSSALQLGALLLLMCDVLCGATVQPLASYANALSKNESSAIIHLRLAQYWHLNADNASTLRRALVLCADHELNASSFAVRVAASTGASLHACVGTGLATLSGPLHGGMTAVIRQHWEAWHTAPAASLAPSLAQLLEATRLGLTPNYCAGFGHPLYPQGDPRSHHLLQHLPPCPARSQLLQAVYTSTGLHPSLDYALVATERSLQLPPGAAFVLFALGRTAGWLAHALEQRASGQLIRPRAQYTGPAPATDPPNPQLPGRVVRFT